MKTTVMFATLGLLLPCISGAQDSASQSVAQGVKFEFGTTVNGVLSDTLDARKSKPGDTIKAKTSEDVKAGGIVVIPRGAKLIGHVTEAQPAAKAGASSDRDSGSGFGGGFGGGSSAVGNMVNAASTRPSDEASALGSAGTRHGELKPSPGAIGGLNSSGTLYASSRGVFGLEDISLEPNTVPSSGSSVILANARSVHLASGTRMLLSLESASTP